MRADAASFTAMVVEDEAVVRMDLERSLARLGARVVATAASGNEALTLARQHQPDLVLLDVRLRGQQDGIVVATALRAELDLAIVFLTAHADDATLARANQVKPDAYLIKPIDRTELERVVQSALDARSLRLGASR